MLLQKNFDSKQQTLRAVTIKQLHDVLAVRQDDSLELDGKELTNVRTAVGGVQGGQQAGLHALHVQPRLRCQFAFARSSSQHRAPMPFSWVTQVTFVARILDISEGGLTYQLKVDDGTGKVDVKIWTSDDGEARCSRVPGSPASKPASRGVMRGWCKSSRLHSPPPPWSAEGELERQKRAAWRPGMYVRVHGHLSNFGESQYVLAFNIRLVADHNEVQRAAGPLLAL